MNDGVANIGERQPQRGIVFIYLYNPIICIVWNYAQFAYLAGKLDARSLCFVLFVWVTY